MPIGFTGDEDVVVLPLFEGFRELKGSAKKLDVLCRSGVSTYIKKVHFVPQHGETALIGLQLPKAPNHVLLLGLGKPESANAEQMARAGGSASKAVQSRGFRSCHLLLEELLSDEDSDTRLHSFLKGFLLGQYDFSLKSKRREKTGLRRVVVLADDTKKTAKPIRTSLIAAHFAGYTRDLVNRPPRISPAMSSRRISVVSILGMYFG